MLFVKVDELRPGMRLGKPIYNKNGVLLYDRDTKLTMQAIYGIRNFGLMGLYILEPAEPVPPMTEDDINFERFQTMAVFSIREDLDLIASGTIDLIINTPTKGRKQDSDGFRIRRSAVEHGVGCVTAIDTARALLTIRQQSRSEDLTPIDITTI